MLISVIAAVADDNAIGLKNRLPWKLPADMRWFRLHTLGKPVIMGRKTFDSINRKPLPDRTNIVITSTTGYHADGTLIATTIAEAMDLAGDAAEVMIIGGDSIYRQMLPRADLLYLTRVHGSFKADAWFPELDPDEWKELEHTESQADANNSHACSFSVLQRTPERVR